MSVIHYSAQELAAVTIAIAARYYWPSDAKSVKAYEEASGFVANFSAANAEAFRSSYPSETAEPCSASGIMAEIERLHSSHGVMAIERRVRPAAAGFVVGARYNLVASDGTDHATIEALDAILSIYRALGNTRGKDTG